MGTRHRRTSLLLAAALLLGQWLVAAHEPDHALQPGVAHGCVVCVYAHGAGAGALPHLPSLALHAGTDAPLPSTAPRLRAVALRHHPIRGPPALLA